MGKQRSLRSKAVNLVSDLTTVLLNPISDKPSNKSPPPPPPPPQGNEAEVEKCQDEAIAEEGLSVEGPDTSSFTAFMYSLLKDDYFSADRENKAAESELESEREVGNGNNARVEVQPVLDSGNVNVAVKEGGGGRRGLLSRGKQTVSKAMSYAARLAWYRNQASQRKPNSEGQVNDKGEIQNDGGEVGSLESRNDLMSFGDLPDMSEPSLLLSRDTRIKLYASLPCLVQGLKWVLLYSTWRHGISLSTLYRKSNLCKGHGLLVVGDSEGAVFGGLVETPLKPNSKKYQGSNTSFLFTDAPGHAVIYQPTGSNRYYTLCSPNFLALGGGRHFALHLDNDLVVGSSAASETYGNPCLSHAEDFTVKHVELWGFAYASRYDEILALSQNEPPGICRW